MRQILTTVIFAGFGLSLTSWSPAAQAFERTRTCGTYGVRPCEDGEVGLPLHWRSPCVNYVVNEFGVTRSNGAPIDAETYAAIRASFDAWNEVDCSELKMVDAGLTPVSIVEGPPADGRERLSLVIFHDEDWQATTGASARSYALTSVSFLPDTGQILDADIEINSADHDLSITGIPAEEQSDLTNTLTHEVGHFLGLAHSQDLTATMYGFAPLAETQKRTLEDDDIAGVCAAYGFEQAPAACDSARDFDQQRPTNTVDGKGGCGCDSSDGSIPSGPLTLLAALSLLGARRRLTAYLGHRRSLLR